MAAITTARASATRSINRDKRPLAAATNVLKGGLAACKAGFFRPASGDPDEIVVGRFYESVQNPGAAGAKSAEIQFFRERNLFLLVNDTGAPVVAANREAGCSILDDQTATLLDPSKGFGGVVYDVDAEGVWIELPFPASPDDAGLPRIQRGTTTLVSGTRTITGVVLTANSVILMSVKAAGAGAITGFGALEAASRNVGAGSFVISALNDSKAVIATAVCEVDYLIIG